MGHHEGAQMASVQDVEGYLIRLGVPFEQLGENTWVIHDEYEVVDNIVVTLNDPVVLFQVKLMEIPSDCDRLALFETLLRLNTNEMIHGAYGLQGEAVVATDTLQAENLDFNEFQASLDALSLCITDHYRKLARFHKRPVDDSKKASL
jgi:hypothetical protein